MSEELAETRPRRRIIHPKIVGPLDDPVRAANLAKIAAVLANTPQVVSGGPKPGKVKWNPNGKEKDDFKLITGKFKCSDLNGGGCKRKKKKFRKYRKFKRK